LKSLTFSLNFLRSASEVKNTFFLSGESWTELFRAKISIYSNFHCMFIRVRSESLKYYISRSAYLTDLAISTNLLLKDSIFLELPSTLICGKL
jgi:hypothetical protein